MGFDPYHKWFGIPKNRRPPTYYDLLGIAPGEGDHEVIRSAMEQRRSFLMANKGQGKDKVIRELLRQLDEAVSGLLVPEVKYEYDRRMGISPSRRKRSRSIPLPAWFSSGNQRIYGEGSGIVTSVIAILTAIVGSIAFMWWFSFQLPWGKHQETVSASAELIERRPSLPRVPEDKSATVASALKAKNTSDPVNRDHMLPASPPPGLVMTLRGHSEYVPHVVVSADGKRIVSGSNDRTVRMWELSTGYELWRSDEFSKLVFSIAISPDMKHVWACDRITIKRFDFNTGAVTKTIDIDSIEPINVNSASFSRDCTRLVARTNDGMIVYDLQRDNNRREFKGFNTSVMYGRNQREVFCGGSEPKGTIQLRDAESGKIKFSFKGLRDRTIEMSVSPDGGYVAASTGPSLRTGPENRVTVWDTNGRVRLTMQIENDWQWALAFTQNNRYLVTGGGGGVDANIGRDDWFGHDQEADCAIRVWEMASKRLVNKFDGHDAAVFSLAITADGKTLVSGSADTTIRIWRMP